MKISLIDTNSMKGVAITFIVWHNLIHWLIPIKENEFVFDIGNSNMFWNHIKELHSTLWMDIFSFLGWYGVAIFLFVSGYGLVRKYEDSQLDIDFKDFTLTHAKKLFTLMALPYLIYLILVFCFEQTINYMAAISQITMLSNLWPPFINPGVYWFFGLMLQLYICFYIFFYKRKNRNLIYFNILSLAIMIFFIVFADNSFLAKVVSNESHYLNYIRHNFIGWILPFSFGILCARLKFRNVEYLALWKNVFILVLCVVLLLLMNFNIYTWLLSPIIAIYIALLLNNILKKFKVINNAFVSLGKISAYLFAVHPLVRYVYVHTINSSDFVLIAMYFIISIIVAVGYKRIYNFLF